MKSSLESKTVRPGLLAYSSYHSDRHPNGLSQQPPPQATPRAGKRKLAGLLFIIAILIGGFIGFRTVVNQQSDNVTTNAATKSTGHPANHASAAAQSPAPNKCTGNSAQQLIRVSISQQHLWACQGAKVAYDAPVVTGMAQYPADQTPTGTYHIYAKQTDLTLTGSDATGQWNDPVSYWMPFLDNQYGTYGFHDATWRASTDFGKVDVNAPYTAPTHGSHGCVEMPVAAVAWLYNWAQVGTTVTIQN